MIEAGAPSTGGVAGTDWHGVRVPPGVVMLSPPTTQRNASKTQSEDRAASWVTSAAQGSIKAGIS
jgi:hypothetical protein